MAFHHIVTPGSYPIQQYVSENFATQPHSKTMFTIYTIFLVSELFQLFHSFITQFLTHNNHSLIASYSIYAPVSILFLGVIINPFLNALTDRPFSTLLLNSRRYLSLLLSISIHKKTTHNLHY